MPKPKKNTFRFKPRFRIYAGDEIALGPGKVDLLKAIDAAGSISQAAREVRMSYKRAWDMVDTMNRCFKKPLVSSSAGGKGGGGASLTPLGKQVVEIYAAMQSKAEKTAQPEWQTLRRLMKKPETEGLPE